MEQEVFHIIKNLVEKESVSPNDGNSLEYVSSFLKDIGFSCQIIQFEDVTNLYAKYGTEGKNLCFAGHVDVVPPGDLDLWHDNPFKMLIRDDRIFARGIVDMKGAIGCFMSAVKRFLENNKKIPFSISFLLTSDEEAIAKYGTVKMLELLEKQGEKIDTCIIGEMTSKERFCDCIKIGRRGSLNFQLEITGMQGHVAYPALIDNPVHRLSRILAELSSLQLDSGNEFFEPSGLQITDFASNSKAVNVCASKAFAKFNIRYNNNFDQQKLYDLIYTVCLKHANHEQISLIYPDWNAHYYLSKKQIFANFVADIVKNVLGYSPKLDTIGGATDGRFISNYCDNVIELGFIENEAHKINESCKIEEVSIIENIYYQILQKYSDYK